MKSRLIHVLALLALIGSTFLRPAGMVSAATEWTCSSVMLQSGGNTNRNVTVKLNYINNPSEKIDLDWGDGSPLLVIHPANGGYLSTTQSHDYGNAAGTYSILMRVWATSPDGSNNDDGDDWHQCGTTVTFNGCSPSGAFACKVSAMDATHHVTATVSYHTTAGQTAQINWGDSPTPAITPLTSGWFTNTVQMHQYSDSLAHTVQLQILDANHNVIETCALTVHTASDVTLSSMSADSPEGGINWTAVGFALLGLVVLGQLALFAVIKQRR